MVLEVLLVFYQFDVQFIGDVKVVLESGESATGFSNVGGNVWQVDKAGEQSVDLGDNGFLILDEGAGRFQHAVNERQDFDSRSAHCVGDFEDGHGAWLRLVEYEDAT